MAKAKLPDALARRHLVEKSLAPAQALRLAEAYLEQERVVEALVFLQKAGAVDRLRAIAEQAKLDGDVFLMRQTAALLGEAPSAADWRAAAEAAREQGKLRFAADAERQATRQES
ncbi:hypothetical protein MYXO_00122 [Myxococcaceae bacterium]|jgi:hypothetical protein|nr:hypothetical protein MYXO_00122 [Myxococcaceae bacterium]